MAFMVTIFIVFRQFEHLKLKYNKLYKTFKSDQKKLPTGMTNSELVLYSFEVDSELHTLVVARSFQFCDPAMQELGGHLDC